MHTTSNLMFCLQIIAFTQKKICLVVVAIFATTTKHRDK